ncbi:MFS transporter [Niveibacterium sp. 24ML]|uniref:MFS transporter n=1 Tax=Niveibacterium sp. 24ML TaxID=2985512 RepID=UPI00226E8A38|nr:MFS transporter [Niveibacterium sp. 24ML]MCX9154909.1 MFS transporter [Niveibacterium sp. 24ML]
MTRTAAALAPPGLLRIGDLLAYGALAVPLAFAALPLYVHVPKLYVDTVGLSLSLVGAVLLAARLGDAVADPLFGLWSDRLQRRRGLTLIALPLLVLGMFGLLRPPEGAGVAWLAAMLVLAYTGYSLSSVNYYAWGAEAGASSAGRTGLTAAREGCALLGVVLASALPELLAPTQAQGLERMLWIFVPLVLVSAWLAARYAPAPRPLRPVRSGASMFQQGLIPLRDRPVLALLAVYALNGIAAAIPATIFLFFVADVLDRERLSGLFLAAYFVSGAAALPLWVKLAGRTGKVRAWLLSMCVAGLAFGWAVSLGEGDVAAFFAICVLSGIALGADITFPPALLADALAQPSRASAGGVYFGWWNLVTKLNLALAAGIALPLLDLLGYQPGVRDAAALSALAIVYAIAPIILKAFAALLLWRVQARIETDGVSR